MLTRSHFSVDVWFIFGSFCYGAEARIVACEHENLVLSINSASTAAVQELSSFFDSITEKAKALVRTEVRVFVNGHPNSPAGDWADELLTTLMTELKPRPTTVTSSTEASPALQVELLDVRGLTPTDQDAWDNLVTQVWPQLPA